MLKSKFNTLTVDTKVEENGEKYLNIIFKTPLSLDETKIMAKKISLNNVEYYGFTLTEIEKKFLVKATPKTEVVEFLKQLQELSNELDKEIHYSLMSIFFWDYNDKCGIEIENNYNKIMNYFLQELCKEKLNSKHGKALQTIAKKNNYDFNKSITEWSAFINHEIGWQELLRVENLIYKDEFSAKDILYLLVDSDGLLDDYFIDDYCINKNKCRELQSKLQKKLIEICHKLDIKIKNYFNQEWLQRYLSA